MENFYPPQQRWLAQKLMLCCSFLLLFFTSIFAQSVDCGVAVAPFELDAVGNLSVDISEVALGTLGDAQTEVQTAFVMPGGALMQTLELTCADVGDVNFEVIFEYKDDIDPMGTVLSTTCIGTITVTDVTPPEIQNIPATIEVENDPGVCGAEVFFLK